METGARTSIVSGKPVADFSTKKAERAARDEARDREKLAMLGVDESDAGRKLVAMALDLLYRRAKALINDDPEAQAFVKVLRELDGRLRAADAALDKFTSREFGRLQGPGRGKAGRTPV